MKTTYQKTGENHLAHGMENQDVIFEAESKTAKILAIADGVSSCSNCKRGAKIACEAVSEIMLNETEYIFESSKKKAKGLLTSYVYEKLLIEARKNNETIESYSSTLCFVCLYKKKNIVMVFVLGDSLVYQIHDRKISLACIPELFDDSRTYTTTTKNNKDIAIIEMFHISDDSKFILVSDGAWKTFYSKGLISEDFEKAMQEENIMRFIENQKCRDDCSIAMLSIQKGA